MNTDVEDLLREGMERFTRDVRAPEGMVRRLALQRRRRLAQHSVAGAAAALTAGAVALVTVVVPAALESGTGTPVVGTAYVVKRVSSALSSAEPGEMAQVTITRRAATPGHRTVTSSAKERSYGDQWRSVTNSATGQPLYDEGFSAGIEAIELKSRPRSLISETIWVTPGTYLPVRVVIHAALGAPVSVRQTADITWLQPTAQNLAKLTIPIPAGFRRVREFPLARTLLLILRQRPGGPQAVARSVQRRS
jgi:hypothetical protein